MSQQLSDPDAFLQPLSQHRERLKDLMQAILGEITKTGRRNARLIESSSAQIDLQVRQFEQLNQHLHTTRIAQEAQAASQADLMQLRREWGAVLARFNNTRLEMNRWPLVRALVFLQARPRRLPLYPDEDRLPRTTYMQQCLSDEVFGWLHAVLNPAAQSASAVEHACFPDIGLPNSDFHMHLHAAYRVLLAQRKGRQARFLDVGCGGGLKVLSAMRYFDQCAGFDFDPAYVAAGQALMRAAQGSETQIRCADALTFEGYGAFDVIYFYRPIEDAGMLAEMEQKIVTEARPGTVLIAPYLAFPARREGLACGHVAGALYVAGLEDKAAQTLRRKAERMGEYVMREESEGLVSIWEPLLAASRSNGFDLPESYRKRRY